jgi:hypothetical protein
VVGADHSPSSSAKMSAAICTQDVVFIYRATLTINIVIINIIVFILSDLHWLFVYTYYELRITIILKENRFVVLHISSKTNFSVSGSIFLVQVVKHFFINVRYVVLFLLRTLHWLNYCLFQSPDLFNVLCQIHIFIKFLR